MNYSIIIFKQYLIMGNKRKSKIILLHFQWSEINCKNSAQDKTDKELFN